MVVSNRCAFLAGSPPRERGIVVPMSLLISLTGITPARAGNWGRGDRKRGEHRDHPRASGELFGQPRFSAHKLGSPPRERGIATPMEHWFCVKGITPARAGNWLVHLALCRRWSECCRKNPPIMVDQAPARVWALFDFVACFAVSGDHHRQITLSRMFACLVPYVVDHAARQRADEDACAHFLQEPF